MLPGCIDQTDALAAGFSSGSPRQAQAPDSPGGQLRKSGKEVGAGQVVSLALRR